MILFAFYDLKFGPVSFDFITWLVRALKKMDEVGAKKLHVVIVPNEGGLAGFARHWGSHDAEATAWRFWHILVASLPLANATVQIAPSREQALVMKDEANEDGKPALIWWPDGKAHFMGPLVEASRRKERIPVLRATKAARRYVESFLESRARQRQPVVTLTLRRQDTDASRNSNPEEWFKLAGWLQTKGYDAIVLEDSNEALKSGRGHFEVDPDLRLALYEVAAMNCISNNGPQELLKYSTAPFMAFDQAQGSWAEHFKKYFSMNPGDQLPWARSDQRLVYAPATFDVMKEEIERWAGATK